MKYSIKKYWWVVALLIIFLFSYSIRSQNIVPDRILSFDPVFQFRFTKYYVDWGHLPAWDELTYYIGREVTPATVPPLMFYFTAILFWFFKGFGLSLLTTASYASAIYGAMIVIPAFLLGNELSNKYGGLLSAILIGTAPQILIRTFGSSYDTDQIVLFFLLLTIYLGYVALKKKDIYSISLALVGFTLFMFTWIFFLYSFTILLGFVLIYFILSLLIVWLKKKEGFSFKNVLSKLKDHLIILVIIIVVLFFIGLINRIDIINNFLKLTGFVQAAEKSIVNISIAELQPFNIFNLEGWILATGRFMLGDMTILFLLIFISFIIGGFLYFVKIKKDLRSFSFLLTVFIVGIYTTFRGIRFTEFTSALFLILIGIGFGCFVKFSERDKLLKSFAIGLGILITISAMSIGLSTGQGLGPDQNKNWDNAWEYLRTKTPENSIVGTWWDPGHMIAGSAERRNYADGAHCPPESCYYPINTRITDLGKIMATTDENESLDLIRKYQGTSPKVYWIASDDLIGKFQWLQYFGTGCDARYESKCPLYMQLSESSRSFDEAGNIVIRDYNMGQDSKVSIFTAQYPIPIFIQGINAALFEEIIIYNNTEALPIKYSQEELNSLITALKPLERQLNVRFTNQTIKMTVWIPRHYSYIVIIPPHLRNSVFTKMFMLEGQELENFRQVFRNEQVKIYEVLQ
jgi:asparagine N-glycosylation enzyme membrane subunit Stt3